MRRDKRGVILPAPLVGSDVPLIRKRYGDKFRGPAVIDAYELSNCWLDLRARALHWNPPRTIPPRLVALADAIPVERRSTWLNDVRNGELAELRLSYAIRSGELPIWVAPIGETDRLVSPGALSTIDRRSIQTGIFCPLSEEDKPKQDQSWLWERPLFIKHSDWTAFAARVDGPMRVDQKRVTPDPQWMRISKAIRILHRVLRTRLAGQEPAPWICPPADPFEAERENVTHRRTARTSFTMRRALLSGDLTAHLVRDGRSHPLPGWVWENAKAAENSFNFNWLPLNPLLEHGLGDFGSRLCFVSRADFKKWIAGTQVAEIGDLPTLSASFDHDAQPDQLSYREPPNRPFIELTEALTWIAFAVSLSHDEFNLMESCGFGPFVASDWPDGFRAAMADFTDQASAGTIRVRGRYVVNYSDHSAAAQANTDYLSDTQLRDFASFDSHYGGLERGAGLVWEGDVLERALQGRGDGWRDVEVCRAELLAAFPPKATSGTPKVFVTNASEPPVYRVKGTGDFSSSGTTRKLGPKSKKGRSKGTGYQRADAPLLEKMSEAIANNPALNATSAAKSVANEAEGASFEAKVDRLARAFRAGRNGE